MSSLECEPEWDARLFTSHLGLGPSPQPHLFSKTAALSSQGTPPSTQHKRYDHCTTQAGHAVVIGNNRHEQVPVRSVFISTSRPAGSPTARYY
jgi:hypothetical protein